MVTAEDVFQHIAKDLRQYQSNDAGPMLAEFLNGCAFDFHIAVTNNIGESEHDFVTRYGPGRSFHFRLADYEHGKRLAGHMYWVLRADWPDLSRHTGEHFRKDDRLYLFVHLRNIQPPPVAQS